MQSRKRPKRVVLTPEIALVEPNPGVLKPTLAVLLRNSETGTPSDAAKSLLVTGSVFANELLLECPSRLDRVEVWRMRRLIDHSDAMGSA